MKDAAAHISESQKRIRAILDKSSDKVPKTANAECEIDAMGSFTMKHHPNTHRDLKSLEDTTTSLSKPSNNQQS